MEPETEKKLTVLILPASYSQRKILSKPFVLQTQAYSSKPNMMGKIQNNFVKFQDNL